jgi:hypothetical protein
LLLSGRLAFLFKHLRVRGPKAISPEFYLIL